jgi:alkylation response protein AidB-like acyl-CoA dehydrogenase
VTLLPDEAVNDTDREIIDRARAWAHEVVAPMSETWERERRFASEAFTSAGEHGLTSLIVPTELGGAGMGSVALARVLEEIAAVDFAVAFSLVVHNNLVGALARASASPLRDRVLQPMIAGELLGAFLLTEPGVGSDAAAIATTARRDGDEWVISGAKAWVSNAAAADVLSVYAQTDESLGHRGIAAFLLPADTPGITREEPYELLGAHAIGTGGFTFDGCRVPAADMFVPVGQGFAAAMAGIDLARLLVAAMSCGMLRAGLEAATESVQNRQAFGGRVADLQAVRFMLADVATDLEASRLLTYRAARQIQDGEHAAVAAAHAKKFATRSVEQRLTDCMQVMGANGARRDHPLPRHLAAARLTHYVDGATEIQNVVIGRSLLD